MFINANNKIYNNYIIIPTSKIIFLGAIDTHIFFGGAHAPGAPVVPPPLPDDDSAEINDEIIDGMEKDRRSKLEVAKDNIFVAQKRQKEQYDRKHHAPEVNFNHNN